MQGCISNDPHEALAHILSPCKDVRVCKDANIAGGVPIGVYMSPVTAAAVER